MAREKGKLEQLIFNFLDFVVKFRLLIRSNKEQDDLCQLVAVCLIEAIRCWTQNQPGFHRVELSHEKIVEFNFIIVVVFAVIYLTGVIMNELSTYFSSG